MAAGHVLVTGSSIRPELLAPLEAAGLLIVNPQETLSEDALIAALDGACAYLKGGGEVATARVLENAAALKVIAFFGMGYESSIDVESARRRGVAITITRDALCDAMADLTLGLVLASVRRIHEQGARVEAGGWSDGVKRRDLASLQIGVIGLGGSGLRIAEVLREGFRAPVSYYSRTRKPAAEARLGLAYRDLDALMGESDVVIVIPAGNPQTWGLIDQARMARAKPGQILINVARPPIVDARALLWGLLDGPLSYAAFDGFYAEPAELVAELKALAPEKLMITPHIGSLTHDARDAMGRKAVQSILNMLERGEDDNRVA